MSSSKSWHEIGWNDFVYGVLSWTDGCSQSCKTLKEWVERMKKLAESGQKERPNDEYFAGIIEAATYWLEKGEINYWGKDG